MRVSAASVCFASAARKGAQRRQHPSRYLAMRADRLTETEARFLLEMRDTLRVRTEAVLNGASTTWLRRYAELFDAVNVPFSGPEEWDRARADAARARNQGLDLCVRTLIKPANAAVDLSPQLVVLAPLRWTLVPSPRTEGDEFRLFAAANARALEELDAEVSVFWGSR